MPTKPSFKIVEVIWADSEQNAAWEKLEDVLNDQGSLNCKTLGYVVADTEDRIILASTASVDDTYEDLISHYMTIPKSCIVSIKELRVKSPAKKKIGIQEQQ